MDPMDTDTESAHGGGGSIGGANPDARLPTSPSSATATTPRTQPTETPAATNQTASSAHSTAASPPAERSATASNRPAQDAPTASKRRRGLGVVTPNACNECRKKRAKCDGNQPCSRCKSLGVPECVYEVRVRQSKEHLREEIELLNRQKRNRDQVLAALARSDRSDLREDVLARLQSGQSVDAISEWLANAPPPAAQPNRESTHRETSSSSGSRSSHPLSGFMGSGPPGVTYGPFAGGISSSNQQGQRQGPGALQNLWGVATPAHSADTPGGNASGKDTTMQRIDSWVQDEARSGDRRFYGMDQVLSPEISEMKVPAEAWTKVTDDSRLVQHLLALYFCWEYPTFASLSKEHFLKDFQDGRTRYCSSILVNALLALGCRFSSHPATRATPDDPSTSGDHFFRECVRLLREEGDHYRMTSIQALGLMSIREASCGRDSESWYYAGQSMRLTLEMGLHLNDGDGESDDEMAVRSATFWGAYSLDLAWCLATGSLPQCSASPRLPPKPAIINDIEASLWIPYTDSGTPVARSCEQPSNVRSVYKCFCELSELVHRSLYILYSPGSPVTGQKLQNIYTDYLNWYDRVPDVLRLGHNFTPSVLFAHMYYHFAILLLFRPFIKLRIKDSSTLPRDICLQAADAIQGLSRSYSKLYTLRRTPSFVPYFVLTSAVMHLTIGAQTPKPHSLSSPEPASSLDIDLARAISRGVADLTEMAPCHHFAEQALNILLHLAKRWHLEIRVRESEQDTAPHLQNLLSQDHAPHAGRPGVRPTTEGLNFFAPEVTVQDVTCAWGAVTPQPAATFSQPAAPPPRDIRRPWEEHERVALQEEPDNPLFWPFPMQGRPLIPSGDKLSQAGFEFL